MNDYSSTFRGYETGFLTLGIAIARQAYSVLSSRLNRIVDLTTNYARQRIFSTDPSRQRLLQDTIRTVNTTSPLPEASHTITLGATNLEIVQTVNEVVTNQLPVPSPVNSTLIQSINTVQTISPTPVHQEIIQTVNQVVTSQLPIPEPIQPIGTPLINTALPGQPGIPFNAPVLTPTPLPDVVKKLLTTNSIAAAALPVLNPAALASAVKGALASLPFLLYALYASKEENLYNINATIDASTEQKIYEIGFGRKGDGHLTIALAVKKNHSIRLLRRKHPNPVGDAIPAVFPKKSSVKRAELFGDLLPSIFSKFIQIPGLNLFIWKRQEYHADCNITINDPGNPLLRDGPITRFIQLSPNEGFNIIHQDPIRPFQNKKKHDHIIDAESSNYVNFETYSIKITDPISPAEEHRTQMLDLPFDNNGGYYLQVTQY